MPSLLKKLKPLLLVISIIVIGASITGLYLYKSSSINIESDQYFIVTEIDNPSTVMNRLEREFGLKHPTVFKILSDRMNMQKWMKKGRYLIKKEMTLIELVNLFREGKRKTVDVVFAPGISLENFADRCGNKLEADTIDFYNILQDSVHLASLGFNKTNVYALIMPDKYNLYWHTQADEILLKMKSEYEKFWNGERMQKLQRCGLSQLEVSTLASIVSKETNKTDEMSMIAGMYINRLKIGMPLQADPTIKFALKEPGLKRILNGHLQVQSPYNTYLNKGLPPGPICIPGKKSIDAVLDFETHDYIFMCAKEDFSGYHNFAANYDDHLKNAHKYRKALDERGIK